MSAYSDIKARAEAVGGTAWIEELLIRGRPADADHATPWIAGSQLSVGWRAPGVTGATVQGVEGPFPVAIAGEDGAWAEAIAALNTAAVDSVAALQAQVQQLTADLATAQQALAALQSQVGGAS